MNWEADPWFAREHAGKVTPEFAKWWLEFYGPPENYSNLLDEQHEYWVRCAYALFGWIARNDHIDKIVATILKQVPA